MEVRAPNGSLRSGTPSVAWQLLAYRAWCYIQQDSALCSQILSRAVISLPIDFTNLAQEMVNY
jgi:hypothetical protein